MNENLIAAKSLLLKHGRKTALKELDFTLPYGCVTALLGRNGAGKSSFLDACLGLITPHSGSLEVLGYVPHKNGPTLRQKLGYVEADPHFDGHEKVATILDMAAALRPRTNIKYRDQLVASLGLSTKAKASQLSRGQRT